MKRCTLIFFAFLCFQVSCASQKESAPASDEASLTEREESGGERQDLDKLQASVQVTGVGRFTETLNAFAFDLAKNLPEQNFVVSPIGAYQIGALALQGTENEAHDELTELMRLQPESNVGEQLKNYLDFLRENRSKKNRAFELRAVSQIWGSERHEWQNEFLSVIEKSYAVRPSNQKFSSHPSVKTWAAESTGDVVGVNFPKLPSNSEIAIVNASFIRGAWLDPFRRGATKDAMFVVGNKKIKVPFLNGASRARVCDDKSFTLVEVPFSDGLASAWIVVPKGDLSSTVSALDLHYFEWAIENANRKSYTLSIPKFEIATALDLTQTLKGMGATSMFDATKDAWRKSVIAPANTKLSVAVAASSIRFDEAGVFGAEVKFDPAPIPEDAMNIVVDKPFLVVVRDNQLGGILLMARVESP